MLLAVHSHYPEELLMDSAVVYECHNRLCTLGTRTTPGRFTGGATQDQVMMITGDPEADHGEGICPNCGEKGRKTGDEFTPQKGEDPLQPLHDTIAAESAPLAAKALDASVEDYTVDDYRADVSGDQSKLTAAAEAEEDDDA